MLRLLTGLFSWKKKKKKKKKRLLGSKIDYLLILEWIPF